MTCPSIFHDCVMFHDDTQCELEEGHEGKHKARNCFDWTTEQGVRSMGLEPSRHTHIGSTFESFLEEQGLLDEVNDLTVKKIAKSG